MNVSARKQYLQHVCGHYGILLRRQEGSNVHILYGGLRCNSWLCPRCRKRKARRFAAAALAYFKGCRVSHLTITDRPDLPPSVSFATFASRWNVFRTYVARRIKGFHYIRVLEEQPSTGRAHYHVLVREYLPREVIEEGLRRAGFGSIYKIHECSDTEAFYYVRKYLAKEWQNESAFQYVIDYNLRLVSGSRGFSLRKAPSEKFELVFVLCTHTLGKSYTKVLLLTCAELGARIARWTASDLSDQFLVSFDSAFPSVGHGRLLDFIDRYMPVARAHGAADLPSDDLVRIINSHVDQCEGAISD